ncbi:MAG TPA: hypothetical protein VMI35_11190 [Puia sp.]|nr:hypothetical protein [Puia sp.]
MKKRWLIGCIAAIVFTGSVQVAHAQHYYVTVRPAEPVVVRPVAPSPHHVWVENEWVWRGGAYVAVPGHWIVPPRGRVRWVPGHWVHEPGHGHYWVAGHWV